MAKNKYDSIKTPFYRYDLGYALSCVAENEILKIVVNHKFSVFNGFKKSMRSNKYWPLIKDFKDLEIEDSIFEKAAVNEWTIYVNDELFEKLIMDEENNWYVHNK